MACLRQSSRTETPDLSLADDTDDLFVVKTLLHGDVLMWLMKTLLTSRCINQRGAGHNEGDFPPLGKASSFLERRKTMMPFYEVKPWEAV